MASITHLLTPVSPMKKYIMGNIESSNNIMPCIDTVSHRNSSNWSSGMITPPDTKKRPSDCCLTELFSQNVVAKLWGVASRSLNEPEPPLLYPEYTENNGTAYVYTDFEFWTSGFFPGCLYLILERYLKYPLYIYPNLYSGLAIQPHLLQLQFACQWWTVNLHKGAEKRDTHDLGFMIQPWARKAWDLNRDEKAFTALVTAANSLASRFDETVGCLRSWDTCETLRYAFTDPTKDFLVIIDNLLNLDLLFWVSSQTREPMLAEIATSHAKRTQADHVRRDSSTLHVVNYDQTTGAVKQKMTNQGYSDESCWSRGQAWGILGFAQTYAWTHDLSFLETACDLADYFLAHLPADGVPYFDFLAPVTEATPRDTSAAMVACYGMLLLHEAKANQSPYLKAALHILTSVISVSMTAPAKFVLGPKGTLEVDMGPGEETILKNATINFYEFAPRRWADHGLVYADYYFLQVGNKLLEMGIGLDFVT